MYNTSIHHCHYRHCHIHNNIIYYIIDFELMTELYVNFNFSSPMKAVGCKYTKSTNWNIHVCEAQLLQDKSLYFQIKFHFLIQSSCPAVSVFQKIETMFCLHQGFVVGIQCNLIDIPCTSSSNVQEGSKQRA